MTRTGVIVAAAVVLFGATLAWLLWDIFRIPDPVHEATPLPENYDVTPSDVVDRMLELADLQQGDMLYDLGSGDGRIVIQAHLQYDARAIGFEIDDSLVALSRRNVVDAGVEDMVRIDQADIFTLDLAEADVITLYLSDDLNARLLPQLRQMKDGALIISHDFGLAGLQPDKVITVTPRGAEDPHQVYAWRTPLPPADEMAGNDVPTRAPDIGFTPTPMPVVEEMLRLANLDPGHLLYDLGSGDGRILIGAAAEYDARAIGYEIDPRLIDLSRQKATDAGLDPLVEIRADDLFGADLADADVVTLYLSPGMNRRLIPQLMVMRPGARIISYSYDLPGVRPQNMISLPPMDGETDDHMIHMWVTPLELLEE